MTISWLSEPSAQDVSLVGGKVANLHYLSQRYLVPTGFCLTTQAFKSWYPAVQAGQVPVQLASLITTAYQQLGTQVNISHQVER